MTPRNKRLAQSSPSLSIALHKYLEEVSIGKKILLTREIHYQSLAKY